MTTAAAPRRPSPADMAGKKPGNRRMYEQAVLASGMHPHSRLVAIALATHADAAGQITDQPRLTGLVHETGLYVRQVVTALTALRQRGWIRQTVRYATYDTADLLLTIPAPILARLRKTTTETTNA